MFDPDHNASPFNNVPAVAVIAVLAMALIEAAVELGAQGYVGGPGAVGWRLDLLNRFAFSGPLVRWAIENHQFQPQILWRFVTYPFVHASFANMAFAAVFTLALGKFVGEVVGGLALSLIWLGAAVAAALAMVLLPASIPLFGGMPPAYGLIGAFTFILWQRARMTGQSPGAAFQLILFLLGIQIVFAVIGGGGWALLMVRMLPDLAAVAAGFGLCALLAPGGWSMLREFIRRR